MSAIRSLLISRPAKLTLSVALVVAVIWQVGPNAVVPRELHWEWMLAAGLLFLASNVVGSVQWNLLLRGAGISLPMVAVIRAYFVALFFNNFLIGNVGGDVLRALDIRRRAGERDGGTEAGVATIVMDRFLGFFTMMCFAVGASLFVSERLEAGAMIFLLLAGFVVLGVAITSRRMGKLADGFLAKLLPERLAGSVQNLRDGFVAMRMRPRALAGALALSALVQGARIVVHFLCSLALGLDVPFIYFITFIPLVSVAAAIPISSGGLGTREWAAVGLFSTVGVAGAGVVAMELAAHAITLITSLPGAVTFVTGRDATARAAADDRETP